VIGFRTHDRESQVLHPNHYTTEPSWNRLTFVTRRNVTFLCTKLQLGVSMWLICSVFVVIVRFCVEFYVPNGPVISPFAVYTRAETYVADTRADFGTVFIACHMFLAVLRKLHDFFLSAELSPCHTYCIPAKCCCEICCTTFCIGAFYVYSARVFT